MTMAVLISPVTMNWRAMCIPKRNPEQAAAMSKQVAFFTPSAGWMIVAVDGIGCSTVAVARIISSISSGVTPASAMARFPASIARVDTLSSGPTTWRSRIPVRDMIHSSDVSTMRSKSLLVRTFSGKQVPRPAIRAVSVCWSCTLHLLRTLAGMQLRDLRLDVGDYTAGCVGVSEAHSVLDRLRAGAAVSHQARPLDTEERGTTVLGVV